MEIDSKIRTKIIILLVSSIISVIVTLITLYIKNKLEKTKLKSDYSLELFKKRLELYPNLIDITQDLGKNLDSFELSQEVLKEIKKGEYYILYSEKSFNEYNKLKKLLKKNPEKKNGYSEEQRKKIFYARNSFRGALRNDLQLGHEFNNGI